MRCCIDGEHLCLVVDAHGKTRVFDNLVLLQQVGRFETERQIFVWCVHAARQFDGVGDGYGQVEKLSQFIALGYGEVVVKLVFDVAFPCGGLVGSVFEQRRERLAKDGFYLCRHVGEVDKSLCVAVDNVGVDCDCAMVVVVGAGGNIEVVDADAIVAVVGEIDVGNSHVAFDVVGRVALYFCLKIQPETMSGVLVVEVEVMETDVGERGADVVLRIGSVDHGLSGNVDHGVRVVDGYGTFIGVVVDVYVCQNVLVAVSLQVDISHFAFDVSAWLAVLEAHVCVHVEGCVTYEVLVFEQRLEVEVGGVKSAGEILRVGEGKYAVGV